MTTVRINATSHINAQNHVWTWRQLTSSNGFIIQRHTPFAGE